METKYLGDKLSRHDSLESLEKVKSEVISPSPPIRPRRKEVELSDHIQFLITEKSAPQKHSEDAVRDQLDDGDFTAEGKIFDLCFYCQIITFSSSFNFAVENLISAATFCRIFPFHLMFDRDMKMVQVGKSVARIIPK